MDCHYFFVTFFMKNNKNIIGNPDPDPDNSRKQRSLRFPVNEVANTRANNQRPESWSFFKFHRNSFFGQAEKQEAGEYDNRCQRTGRRSYNENLFSNW